MKPAGRARVCDDIGEGTPLGMAVIELTEEGPPHGRALAGPAMMTKGPVTS